MLRTENISKEEGGNKKFQVYFLLSVLCIDQNPHKGICCNMQRETLFVKAFFLRKVRCSLPLET